MIYNFKMSLEEYVEKGRDLAFPDIYGCQNPNCCYQGRMNHHGFYERNAISFNGIHRIPIHRYICPVCNKTFSLLPSFLLPYYQYTLTVLYICLYRYGALKKTLLQVVESLDLVFMSHQHVSFYVNRLRKNEPLCWAILYQLGYTSSGSIPFMKYWCQEVKKTEVERFSLTYFGSWGKSFLSLAS